MAVPDAAETSDAPSTGAHPQGAPNWTVLALAVFAIVAAVLAGFIIIFS
jgi:hypothetical protein